MGLIAFDLSLQLLGIGSLFFFLFRKKRVLSPDGPYPDVSLVKPCYANADGEEKNFDVLFRQDYPGKLQILFAVSEPDDPIVPVVEAFLRKYPDVDARIVVSTTREAYWRKIDALYDAQKKVKYDLVIWSDSDAIVRENYVSSMVACLEEPGVSLVTTPQYDTRGNTFASIMKNLGNNCDVATYLMLLNLFSRRKKVGWGHSLGFHRADFEAFEEEAWECLRTHFADDQMMPSLFTKHKKRVVFRHIYCPVEYSNKRFSEMLNQQSRFALCQKAALGNRWLFLVSFLGLPQFPAVALLLVTGFSWLGVLVCLAVFFFRVAVSLTFEGLVLGSVRQTLLYFWIIPVWDLLKVYFFAYAFFTDRVTYHGKTYRFVDRFRLEEVTAPNKAMAGLTVMEKEK